METLKYKKLKFLYKKGDYKGLNKFIGEVDWKEEFDGKSIKGTYSRFLEIYNEACELFIPKIYPNDNCRKNSKWMNNGIKSSMRKILHLWHANKRSGLNKTDLPLNTEK